jgi:3-phenylpropionate/trans-cinnamate dioxygenase ferredoxin subunit
VDAGAVDDFEPGRAVRVTVDGTALAVVRIGDEFHCVADRCSHADVALSEGEVDCDAREIECIRHGSAFSLVTGVPSTLPATQPVAVHRVRVEDGRVMVEIEPVSPGDEGKRQ